MKLLDKSRNGFVTRRDFLDVVEADSDAPWLRLRELVFNSVFNGTFHISATIFKEVQQRHGFHVNELWAWHTHSQFFGCNVMDVALTQQKADAGREKALLAAIVDLHQRKDECEERINGHKAAMHDATGIFDSLLYEVASWCTLEEAQAVLAHVSGVQRGMAAQQVLGVLMAEYGAGLASNSETIQSGYGPLYVHESLRKSDSNYWASLLDAGLVVYSNVYGYGRISSVEASTSSLHQDDRGFTVEYEAATLTDANTDTDTVANQVGGDEARAQTTHRHSVAEVPNFIIEGRMTPGLVDALLELRGAIRVETDEVSTLETELSSLDESLSTNTESLEDTRRDQENRSDVIASLKNLGAKPSAEVEADADADAEQEEAKRGVGHVRHKNRSRPKNSKSNETTAAEERKYTTLLSTLGQLDLGGLMPLVDALDSHRSLYGVALSSVDSLYVLLLRKHLPFLCQDCHLTGVFCSLRLCL